MILDDIVVKKRERLKVEMQQISIEGFKQKIKGPGLHKPLDFGRAIKRENQISVIAEVKKASPSAGIIREDFEPVSISREYMLSGAQAISVLTEKDFFMGDDEFLGRVRQTVSVPVLRKDFIIDLWQIYQARCLGADAVLLITALLSDDLLNKMLIVSKITGMQCLVEVHDERELERALEAGAKIIGINNRNLKTFEVDINNTARLINLIPKDIVVVSESGIRTAADIKYLKDAGADAVLVGETLMRAPSAGEKLKELLAF